MDMLIAKCEPNKEIEFFNSDLSLSELKSHVKGYIEYSLMEDVLEYLGYTKEVASMFTGYHIISNEEFLINNMEENGVFFRGPVLICNENEVNNPIPIDKTMAEDLSILLGLGDVNALLYKRDTLVLNMESIFPNMSNLDNEFFDYISDKFYDVDLSIENCVYNIYKVYTKNDLSQSLIFLAPKNI